MKVNEDKLERAADIIRRFGGLEAVSEYAAGLEQELLSWGNSFYERPKEQGIDNADTVLTVLAKRAGYVDEVCMSIGDIADRAGMKTTAVKQTLDELVDDGRLELIDPRRGRKPATYKIL